MKKLFAIITLIATLLFTHNSNAQGGWTALTGSGKVVQLTPETGNFDKISVAFNAKTIVQIGKPNSVVIDIDDNLAKFIKVRMDAAESKLIIESNFPKNTWLQSSNIVIRVSMPEMSVFTQKSNGNTTINGLNGRYLRAENYGNGAVILRGLKMDKLDIVNNGNGEVEADKMTATTAKIEASGNGKTTFNATQAYAATLKGNGDITNIGNGKATESNVNGNGSINDKYSTKSKKQSWNSWENERNQAKTQVNTPQNANQKIKISLRNNSPLPRKYTVITYQPSDNGSNGTQGFVLMPTFSKEFQLEVGTRLYIADGNQIDTVMGGQKLTGTPFLTVKAEDGGKIFGLNK